MARKSKRKQSTLEATEAEQHEEQEEEEEEQENGRTAGEAQLPPPAKKRSTGAQRLVDEAASMFQNKAPGVKAAAAPVRRSSRNEKNVEGAAGGAADTPGDKFRMYTDESFQAQWTAMEMLLTNADGGWIFEMDVEGRGDCWGFANLAGEQPSSLHTTAA